ncbi:Arm DNA-binding domain-containing protein [Microseira sp. BLCC-F43]|uniref:Arm DNA-binding domain-containing protein n=1 Tax=Microseira sp. BLCC-F43 TaxID=3153602 RepID=UPI0035B859E0
MSSHRGMLRLQLPRHLFGGQQKYLYLGLADTPTNQRAAQDKAQAIASDIAFNRFDFTLERYRPHPPNDNSPSLSEIWQKYTFYKSKFLAHSTL